MPHSFRPWHQSQVAPVGAEDVTNSERGGSALLKREFPQEQPSLSITGVSWDDQVTLSSTSVPNLRDSSVLLRAGKTRKETICRKTLFLTALSKEQYQRILKSFSVHD